MNVTVRKIGNSEGIILPKEMLDRHNLRAGDTLLLTEDGDSFVFTAELPAFAMSGFLNRHFTGRSKKRSTANRRSATLRQLTFLESQKPTRSSMETSEKGSPQQIYFFYFNGFSVEAEQEDASSS